VYKRGANQQPVAAALPLKNYSVMPLQLSLTKQGNFLGHALDHGQLTENAEAAVRKGLGGEFGNSAAKIVEKARTMLEAISKGQPSESVVTPSQKRLIYSLTGLDPKVNGQNIFNEPRNSRSNSIYTTSRIDRINSLSIDPSHKWGLNSGIYNDLAGYKTPGKLALKDSDGSNILPSAFEGHRDAVSGLAASISSQQAQQSPYLSLRSGLSRLILGRGATMNPATAYARQVAESVGATRSSGVPRAQLVGPGDESSGMVGSQVKGWAPRATLVRLPGNVSYSTARQQALSELAPQNRSLINSTNPGDQRERNIIGSGVAARIRQLQGRTGNAPATAAEVQEWKNSGNGAQPAIAVGPQGNVVRSNGQQNANPGTGLPNVQPGTNRMTMARNILNLETDTSRGLKIDVLPRGDGGGAGNLEVGGITQKFDGPMSSRLVSLIRSGQQKEAMHEATAYVADQTDRVQNYVSPATLAKNPGIDQFLRDTYFHQGSDAMKRILARTWGYSPRYMSQGAADQAINSNPTAFLEGLKQNRLLYLDRVQNVAGNLRNGVISRINQAHSIARSMQ
jgi:hypothetical protein